MEPWCVALFSYIIRKQVMFHDVAFEEFNFTDDSCWVKPIKWQVEDIHVVGFLSKLLETKIMQVLRFKHGQV